MLLDLDTHRDEVESSEAAAGLLPAAAVLSHC